MLSGDRATAVRERVVVATRNRTAVRNHPFAIALRMKLANETWWVSGSGTA